MGLSEVALWDFAPWFTQVCSLESHHVTKLYMIISWRGE